MGLRGLVSKNSEFDLWDKFYAKMQNSQHLAKVVVSGSKILSFEYI